MWRSHPQHPRRCCFRVTQATSSHQSQEPALVWEAQQLHFPAGRCRPHSCRTTTASSSASSASSPLPHGAASSVSHAGELALWGCCQHGFSLRSHCQPLAAWSEKIPPRQTSVRQAEAGWGEGLAESPGAHRAPRSRTSRSFKHTTKESDKGQEQIHEQREANVSYSPSGSNLNPTQDINS